MEQSLILFNQDLTYLVNFFLPRLLFALLCGAIVGLEREVKGKSAGLKTSILICLGSMLFSSLSVIMADLNKTGDPLRIAAQIVSGIGFLGAGVILQSQNKKIVGITTAAVIWFMGAIGVCIGMGLFAIALASSLLCIFILVGLRLLEEKVISKFQSSTQEYFLEVGFDLKSSNCFNDILETSKKNKLVLVNFTLKKNSSEQIYTLQMSGSELNNQLFINEIVSRPDVGTFNYNKT